MDGTNTEVMGALAELAMFGSNINVPKLIVGADKESMIT